MLMNPPKKKSNMGFLSFVGMAFQMITTIVLFTLLGFQADKLGHWLQTKFPVFTLLGVFCGMGISFYSIFKAIKKIK